jgi:hypothetical protein
MQKGVMKQILDRPTVRQLAQKFDLEKPQLHNILIDDYELNNGMIVIKSAKVLDDNFEVVRFAKLDKLIDSLSVCNLIFK